MLQEIRPAAYYGLNDMVKIECQDCKGCFACCHDMGSSILLNPYDIWQLSVNLKKPVEWLLQEKVELGVEDGVILPHLRMQEKTNACGFLSEEGRCGIHGFRPGLCRLFPLGREYKDGKISYFILEGACEKPVKTKIKVSKWLGIPQIKQHEAFLCTWHELVKKMQKKAESLTGEENKAWNLQFLQQLYLTPYETADFYNDFNKRAEEFRNMLI
ncbi:MAG: YkgJ family cysteine cluster protein [Lachnospiraceae bacterium]